MDFLSGQGTSRIEEVKEILMIEFVAESLTRRLVKTQVVENEDYAIYFYGMKQLLQTFVNIGLTILYGILMGELYQSVIYVISFMLIRKYAGGYHCTSQIRCYILTSTVILSALSAIKYCEFSIYLELALFVLSNIVIVLLSPVETSNKPLDDIEKIVYRKRTLIMLGLEDVMAVLLFVMGMREIVLCIIIAEFTLGLSLTVGKLSSNI